MVVGKIAMQVRAPTRLVLGGLLERQRRPFVVKTIIVSAHTMRLKGYSVKNRFEMGQIW